MVPHTELVARSAKAILQGPRCIWCCSFWWESRDWHLLLS